MLNYSTRKRQSINDVMENINSSGRFIYGESSNPKAQNYRPEHLLIPSLSFQKTYAQTMVFPKTARTPFTQTKNISEISKFTPQKKKANKETPQLNTTKINEKQFGITNENNQNTKIQPGHADSRTQRTQRTSAATIFSNTKNKHDNEAETNYVKLRQTTSNRNQLQFNSFPAKIKFLRPQGQRIKASPANIIDEPCLIKKVQSAQTASSANQQQLKDAIICNQVISPTRPLKAIMAEIAQILPIFSNEPRKRETISNQYNFRYSSTSDNIKCFGKFGESHATYNTTSPIKLENVKKSQPSSLKVAVRHHSTTIDTRDLAYSSIKNDYRRKSKPFDRNTSPIRQNYTVVPELERIKFISQKSQQKVVFKAKLDREESASKIVLKNKEGFASRIRPSFHRTSNEFPGKAQNLQDFYLGQCKGTGRFGRFFPAIHKQTGFLVGIKQIQKESVRLMLDQFTQQIKISLFLDYPNIVKMYGYFHDQAAFYIIMEYMEEGSLYKIIKEEKKLTEEATAVKMKQICDAVHYMHERDILHRDIKPENIVLSHGVSKLCDFGWATFSRDRRSTYCGTLDYVCPEILEGSTYDNFVDIWAIGVLAFEMVVGKAPFYHISRQQTIKNITKCDFILPKELTSNAKLFIMKALQKNPDERFTIDLLLQQDFISNVSKL